MDSKKIRKQYVEAFPRLDKVLQLVRQQLEHLPPSDFVVETNMKPYHSAKRKFSDDRLDDILRMSDLVRGRIFFSDQYNYNDVIALLKKLLKGWIKNIDVKFDKGHGLEYHGIYHIDLDVDGINFELQIMPKEFQPFKEYLHSIYEKFRDPDKKLSDEEKNRLKNVHNKLYATIDTQARANRNKNNPITFS